MAVKPLIVLVDDEADLAGAFADYLRRRGYRAETAGGGAGLDAILSRAKPDLIVLDLAMPGENGRAILNRLKPALTCPVIILTSTDDAIDRIVLIETGADDYAVKPIAPRELAARVGRLLGRYGKAAPETLRFETVTADLAGGELLFDDGREGRLSPSEISLLRVLSANPGQVISREEILSGLAEDSGDIFDRAIDNRISRLRKKLATEMIATVRGAGYKFTQAE